MNTTTSLLESRAAAYLAKLPPATAGAGGHSATFSAACRLVEFGLSFEQAAPLFAAWNETHCQPKWTAADLRHKLADAFKRTTAKPEFVAGRREVVTHRVTPRPARSQPSVTDQADAAQLAATIQAIRYPRPAATSETTMAAAIQQTVTQFKRLGDFNRVNTLARLRGLNSNGVMHAYGRGLLRFGNHFGHPAWFVLDRSLRNACARRMDGLPWNQGTPAECKAMILRGSQAKWPIGIREAEDSPKILLCEGAPDFLAAFHFAVTLGQPKEFAPVVMLSGSYPIHTDALRLFTGKRVRIYAHNDGTGTSAAARWVEQIKHRATVDVFSFAHCSRVKDLNDFARGNFPTDNILP